MTDDFAWSPAYATGHGHIDTQHRKLLRFASLFQSASRHHLDHALVSEALDAVVDYARHHFVDEEAVLESIRSPHAALHKAEHTRLTEELLAIRHEHELGVLDVAEPFRRWVCLRLLPHITYDDRLALGPPVPRRTTETPA